MAKKLSAKARYAAKLLFQFRVVADGKTAKRRLCEERIVVLTSGTAKLALAKAKHKGKRGEHHYKNAAGATVYYEFIGVMELLRLGVERDEEEVWHNFVERILPDERRSVLLPPESKLNAILLERREIGRE